MSNKRSHEDKNKKSYLVVYGLQDPNVHLVVFTPFPSLNEVVTFRGFVSVPISQTSCH